MSIHACLLLSATISFLLEVHVVRFSLLPQTFSLLCLHDDEKGLDDMYHGMLRLFFPVLTKSWRVLFLLSYLLYL